jgi:hypothetical protein
MGTPKFILAPLVVALLFGSAAVATAQAVASTEVFTAPFSLTLAPADYPCLQEVIVVDGTLHYVVRVTLDASGGRHRATLINAQGLTGLGLDSGTVYRGVRPGSFDVKRRRLGAAGARTYLLRSHPCRRPGRRCKTLGAGRVPPYVQQ